MAILINTNKNSYDIVRDIRFKIDDGEIEDWIYDEDGDFTLKDSLLNEKAWMSPTLTEGLQYIVMFNIIGRKGGDLSSDEYAAYHGKFVELLIKYYGEFITNLIVTMPKKSEDKLEIY